MRVCLLTVAGHRLHLLSLEAFEKGKIWKHHKTALKVCRDLLSEAKKAVKTPVCLKKSYILLASLHTLNQDLGASSSLLIDSHGSLCSFEAQWIIFIPTNALRSVFFYLPLISGSCVQSFQSVLLPPAPPGEQQGLPGPDGRRNPPSVSWARLEISPQQDMPEPPPQGDVQGEPLGCLCFLACLGGLRGWCPASDGNSLLLRPYPQLTITGEGLSKGRSVNK